MLLTLCDLIPFSVLFFSVLVFITYISISNLGSVKVIQPLSSSGDDIGNIKLKIREILSNDSIWALIAVKL